MFQFNSHTLKYIYSQSANAEKLEILKVLET